jgi:hypothetical protein
MCLCWERRCAFELGEQRAFEQIGRPFPRALAHRLVAFADMRLHCASLNVRMRSASRVSAATSSTSTQAPLKPSTIASAGQPVRVETTGVRHAIASIAGRLKPSLLLAVSHTSQDA